MKKSAMPNPRHLFSYSRNKKKTKERKSKKCEACNGNGGPIDGPDCKTCEGFGVIFIDK